MKTLPRLAGVVAVLLACGPARPADPPKPLSEADVLKWIEVKIPDDVIIDRVKAIGVDFANDESIMKRLRKAGASDAVLAAVRTKARPAADKVLSLWVKREYGTWDNPLHSELTVNGKSIGTFTSDSEREVADYLKPGWNTLVLKTTPQPGATNSNKLIFRVGPVARQDGRRVMTTTLWEFQNGTDWRFDGGKYTHQLGPDVKDVTLTFRLFLGRLDLEGRKPAEGDFILRGRQEYGTSDTPVTATVYVRDEPVTSFVGPERTVVITDLLRKGENKIKVVSQRVPNLVANNDIKFQVSGPAEYNVGRGRFEFPPKLQFDAMFGWKRDQKSGKLLNQKKAGEDTIEQSLSVTLDREPGKK